MLTISVLLHCVFNNGILLPDFLQDENWLSWVFEKVVLVMVCYFVISIVNSMAQSYAKRLQTRRNSEEKTKWWRRQKQFRHPSDCVSAAESPALRPSHSQLNNKPHPHPFSKRLNERKKERKKPRLCWFWCVWGCMLLLTVCPSFRFCSSSLHLTVCVVRSVLLLILTCYFNIKLTLSLTSWVKQRFGGGCCLRAVPIRCYALCKTGGVWLPSNIVLDL